MKEKSFPKNGNRLYEELFGKRACVSLSYEDAPVDWAKQSWTVQMREEDAYQLERRVCTLADGVHVALNIRRFWEDPVVEWFLELENTSAYDSGIFSDIDEANVEFLFEPSLTPFFYDSNGSAEQLCDFMTHKTQMFHRARRNLAAEGGRSSSYTMPYFNLAVDGYGYIIAIGWSGQWRAQAVRPNDDGLIRFRAGMEDGYFRLHAGEKVTLPRMLVLRWEGTEHEGYNAYRRFAFRNIVPKIGGKPIQSPICISSWGGAPAKAHLADFEVIRKHGLKGDVYWIDAGWYGDAPATAGDDGTWYPYVGINDWSPNPALYPNGMEEVADGARAAGLEFLLWYEPERCRTNAKRAMEHPEWYLGLHKPKSDLVLNLGHSQAREWLTELLKDHIRRLRMKVLRIDFNFGPLPFWRYSDTQDRQGISELKYVEGFYRLWDDLLAEFPELIIDNCASGGRRLDYEALRRSIPLFRTDYACFGKKSEPVGYQLQTYYLNTMAAVHATSVEVWDNDLYTFRSAFASGITMGVPPAGAPEETFAFFRKSIEQAYRMRPYMSGDYWPLTGCSYSEKDWMAYQMDLPGSSGGMVIAFRRSQSMTPAMDFELTGIDPEAVYETEDLDTNAIVRVSGKTLREGWRFELPEKRSSRVVLYRKI